MATKIPPTVLAFGKRHGLSAADLETLKKALRPLDIQDMRTRQRVVIGAERILKRLARGQQNNASTPEGRAVIESARREGTQQPLKFWCARGHAYTGATDVCHTCGLHGHGNVADAEEEADAMFPEDPIMTRRMALNVLTGGYADEATFNQQLFVDNALHDGRLADMTTDEDVRAAYARWQAEVDKA